MKGGGPIRRRNPKRRAREFARAYGSEARVLAIKALSCHACHNEPAENAHLPSRSGMGRKGDWDQIVDLGAECHRLGKYSLHKLGSVKLFDEHHGTDLRARAAFLAEFLDPAKLEKADD